MSNWSTILCGWQRGGTVWTLSCAIADGLFRAESPDELSCCTKYKSNNHSEISCLVSAHWVAER